VASGFSRSQPSPRSLRLQILNRPNIIVAVAGVILSLLLIRRLRIAAFVAAGVLAALAPVVVRNAASRTSSRSRARREASTSTSATTPRRPASTWRCPACARTWKGSRRTRAGWPSRRPDAAQRHAGFRIFHRPRARLDPRIARPRRALFAKKLALVFNARHQWLDFSYPYYAYDTGSILWALFVGPWLLVPLGVAGLICVPTDRRDEYLAYASFVPLYAVSVALFFVAERYRLPLFASLCATSGATVDLLLRALRGPTSVRQPSTSDLQPPTSARGLAVPAAVLIAAAALTAWPLRRLRPLRRTAAALEGAHESR
jgi:HAMP domain-containing protein